MKTSVDEVIGMGGLLIESPKAKELALAIASRTGRPVEEVVTDALEAQFQLLPKKRESKASLEELLAIADRISSRLTGPPVDHGEFLYDEHGLPK